MGVHDSVYYKYTFLSHSFAFLRDRDPMNFTPNQQEYIHTLYDCIFNHKSIPSKKELRKELRKRRVEYDPAKLVEKSARIAEKVINSKAFRNARIVFCYLSYNNEITTNTIVEAILNSNKKLAVPLITGSIMTAAGVDNLDNFVKNKYGIAEPINYTTLSQQDIDLIIVPGLGYNPFGYRIGYGGGFYDKYLHNFKGKTIGMVLKEFVLNNFIPSEYDIPVDKLVIG